MSTVLDPNMPTQEEIDTFEMPPVLVGRIVRWYPNAQRNERTMRIAVITKVSKRTCDLTVLAGGQILDVVRHVNDPKLRLNESQREMGAWDFTEEDVRRDQEILELQKKLDSMAKQLTAVMTSSARKQ